MPDNTHGLPLVAKCGWRTTGSRRMSSPRGSDLAGSTARTRILCIASLGAVPTVAQCVTSFF